MHIDIHTHICVYIHIYVSVHIYIHRQASPFNPLANGFVSLSTNWKTTNFRLHDEQTVNGLMKIAWASFFRLMSSWFRVSMPPCLCHRVPCLHVSGIPQSENGSNGKGILPFVSYVPIYAYIYIYKYTVYICTNTYTNIFMINSRVPSLVPVSKKFIMLALALSCIVEFY